VAQLEVWSADAQTVLGFLLIPFEKVDFADLRCHLFRLFLFQQDFNLLILIPDLTLKVDFI